MNHHRSLALVATAATAISLAAVPGVAFAARPAASASAHHGAAHHTAHRAAAHHQGRHGRPAVVAAVDSAVTAQLDGLPDNVQAGRPTTFSVTYANNGDTDYPVSALALNVVDADQPASLTPADFTVSYQYNGAAAAWGSCEQEAGEDGAADVSCYLDGGQADTALAPGAAITVQVTLTFAAGYEADDASVTATPALYASEDQDQEVDGVASESSPFAVSAQ